MDSGLIFGLISTAVVLLYFLFAGSVKFSLSFKNKVETVLGYIDKYIFYPYYSDDEGFYASIRDLNLKCENVDNRYLKYYNNKKENIVINFHFNRNEKPAFDRISIHFNPEHYKYLPEYINQKLADLEVKYNDRIKNNSADGTKFPEIIFKKYGLVVFYEKYKIKTNLEEFNKEYEPNLEEVKLLEYLFWDNEDCFINNEPFSVSYSKLSEYAYDMDIEKGIVENMFNNLQKHLYFGKTDGRVINWFDVNNKSIQYMKNKIIKYSKKPVTNFKEEFRKLVNSRYEDGEV